MPANSGAISGTVAHTHAADSADGGPLAANTTEFGLSSGSILFSDGNSIQELVIGGSSTVLTESGGSPVWSASPGAITTTKGDLSGFSTTQARVPISSNNFSLLCDTAEALGLKWAASSTSILTTTGDLLAASAANVLTRIGAHATNGYVLTSNGAGVLPTYQAIAASAPRSFWSARYEGTMNAGDSRSNTANGFGDWNTGGTGCGENTYCENNVYGANCTIVECAISLVVNGIGSTTTFNAPNGNLAVTASTTGTFTNALTSSKAAGSGSQWGVNIPAGSGTMEPDFSWTAYTLDET